MKKEYDFWANKRNIPHLELYTKLIGIFWGLLGVNFLMIFFYWKFILQYENSGLILVISIVMFALVPMAMTDSKKANRDLVAVVATGVAHGIFTIGSVLVTHFWLLLIIYGIEILLVILVVVRNFRINKK